MTLIYSSGRDRTSPRTPESRKVTSGCHRHSVWDLDCATCKRKMSHELGAIARTTRREILSTRNDRYGR